MASSKIDQFADIGVLRYEVPGFAELSLREKLFIYYLSKATAAGQEIIWDQNCRYNLAIKQALTKVYQNYGGDRDCQDFQDLLVYIKRVFTSNGIHHHYSRDKILPSCSQTYLQSVFVSL